MPDYLYICDMDKAINNDKLIAVEGPELLDRAILNIQQRLAGSVEWLDRVFGRAERLVRMTASGRRYFTPNVYAGGNDYIEVSPDSQIGNFAFFWIDDPQSVRRPSGGVVALRCTASLIVWFDFRRVLSSGRNKEQVKRQLLDVLNGGLRRGRFTVERVYELAENIYHGFSLDEIDNQFLMHPFGGFRFEGILEIEENCR